MSFYNQAKIDSYFQMIKSGQITVDFVKCLNFAIEKYPGTFIGHDLERELGHKSSTARTSHLCDLGLFEELPKRPFKWRDRNGKLKESTVTVYRYVPEPHRRKELSKKRFEQAFKIWKAGAKRFGGRVVRIITTDDPEGGQLNLF